MSFFNSPTSEGNVALNVEGEIDVNESQSLSAFGSKMKLPTGLTLASPNAREWFQTRKQHLKPWLTFLSTSKFKPPLNPQRLTKRIIKNVEYFQSNYMFVFIILIIYCLITSPMLLIAVAASMGGCYIISLKNAERKLIIAGHELTLIQQYAIVGLLSFPLFYLAGATAAIFWVIGASFFLIMIHASFYDIESIIGADDKPFDLQMEEV